MINLIFFLHNSVLPIERKQKWFKFTTFVSEIKQIVALWILERDIYMK